MARARAGVFPCSSGTRPPVGPAQSCTQPVGPQSAGRSSKESKEVRAAVRLGSRWMRQREAGTSRTSGFRGGGVPEGLVFPGPVFLPGDSPGGLAGCTSFLGLALSLTASPVLRPGALEGHSWRSLEGPDIPSQWSHNRRARRRKADFPPYPEMLGFWGG